MKDIVRWSQPVAGYGKVTIGQRCRPLPHFALAHIATSLFHGRHLGTILRQLCSCAYRHLLVRHLGHTLLLATPMLTYHQYSRKQVINFCPANESGKCWRDKVTFRKIKSYHSPALLALSDLGKFEMFCRTVYIVRKKHKTTKGAEPCFER